MKKLLLFISLLVPVYLFASPYDRLTLDSVDYYISRQAEYDNLKDNRILSIKEKIAAENHTDSLYSLYTNLFEEYQSYIYDSAYVCVEKLIDISSQLNDSDKTTLSLCKMGFCYLSSGLFKEAFDILASIDVSACCDDTKIDYYIYKSRLYYDLADYNNNDEFRRRYDEIGNQIIDSALLLLPMDSSRFWGTIGLKRMKSDNTRGAIQAFLKMIDTNDYSEHDLAISTSSIGYLHTLQGNTKEAIQYFMQAAISDIKSATKEAVALRNLAQLIYEEGDVEHAALFINQALEDAYFYNARHRQLEIGNILPIIEGQRITIIQQQRDRLTQFVTFISILLVLLLITFLIIWKQLKRLNQAKRTIQSTNDELVNANNQLTEANKIKDEYIGFFFSQNSEFIEKLEGFQKWVNRKIMAKQYDDLKTVPQNFNINKERENLYLHFDQIFLKLFPDFVNQFNALLRPEEQIQLKKGELLNADLRIYALIRLGINDNEKIAQFLDYSVNTIYTYKTKTKNKALVPGDEFTARVMNIQSI